jgi:hypothetical protein
MRLIVVAGNSFSFDFLGNESEYPSEIVGDCDIGGGGGMTVDRRILSIASGTRQVVDGAH